MKIMTETNDGFLLSEKVFRIAGAGILFGTKQSGSPDFKVADMVHDYRALERHAGTLTNSSILNNFDSPGICGASQNLYWLPALWMERN